MPVDLTALMLKSGDRNSRMLLPFLRPDMILGISFSQSNCRIWPEMYHQSERRFVLGESNTCLWYPPGRSWKPLKR